MKLTCPSLPTGLRSCSDDRDGDKNDLDDDAHEEIRHEVRST